jgi:hypothetical protein
MCFKSSDVMFHATAILIFHYFAPKLHISNSSPPLSSSSHEMKLK